MDEVELEVGYPLSFFSFHLPVIITPLLHIHLLPCREMCGSPVQAVYCHVFVLSVRTLSLTYHILDHKVRKCV